METVRIVGLVGSSISLELGEGTNILGRSNAALGIVDGGVSRRHASIVVNSDLGTVTLNSVGFVENKSFCVFIEFLFILIILCFFAVESQSDVCD